MIVLRSGARARECLKEQAHRFLNLLVGIKHHASRRIVDQADGKMVVQFAPARLIKNAATQARPQDVKFRFTHRSFEPKQQSVIEVRGIIQPVLVEDQRIRSMIHISAIKT